MGQSLHRVKLEYIKGTGAFASSEGKEQKTFREEWMLPYSLIVFHGLVNENSAKETNLTEEDLKLLRKGLWEGTKNLITRSKNGQMPRLLIEVIYKEGLNSHIGDLHRYIKLKTDKTDEELRSPEDYILDIDNLLEVLEEESDKIEKVLFKKDRNLKLSKELKSDKVAFEEN
ncbi:MAG: type I CRISPR-associated protein Cas7 [Persephonella sp.]|nr:type I CRISPR-associated protein Cas7 [Persephonella sp.]